jgi:hypothetical protein
MSFISKLKDTAAEYGFLKELDQITVTLYPYNKLLHTSYAHNNEYSSESIENNTVVLKIKELENLNSLCETCTLGYDFFNNIVDPILSDFFRAFYALVSELQAEQNHTNGDLVTLEDLVMLSNYFSTVNNEHSEDVMQAYFILEGINPITAEKVYLELIDYVNAKHKRLIRDNPSIELLLSGLSTNSGESKAEFFVAIDHNKTLTEREKESIPVKNWYGSVNRFSVGVSIASLYNRNLGSQRGLLRAPFFVIKLIEEYAPSSITSELYSVDKLKEILSAKQLWSSEASEIYYDFDKAFEAITLV